jgi:hypothetical protein
MTAKSKKHRAPRGKAGAPKGETKETNPNLTSEAEKLVARWNFLEADAAYKASIAATSDESENFFTMHARELDQIAVRLAELKPNSLYVVLTLLWFVVEQTKDGELRRDDLELKIIRSVTAALPEILREKRKRVYDETKTTAIEFARERSAAP